MEFKEIDGLNSEEITAIYNDIIEFGYGEDGDDMRLADYYNECCCYIEARRTGICTYFRYMTYAECTRWCPTWCRNSGTVGLATPVGYNYAHYFHCGS